ncbi:hypothetical protein RvY_07811 [Ramazzottius varieornatus]|uniref:Methyltransferase-like protein 17, mitochondrial n=1 Tax=Ramazzottius varieornatus TaxID=947166 RepID=A0A1D1V8I3_RAMVA|nr:hypothetical protein RvY_07811 [Ramazzottius varieornatus]
MRAIRLSLCPNDVHVLRVFRRHYGVRADRTLKWDLEESVEPIVRNEAIKTKDLPGNDRLGANELPVNLTIAINRALLKFDPIALRKDSAELRRLLTNRRAPAKDGVIRTRAKTLERQIMERDDIKMKRAKMSPEEQMALQKDLAEKVLPQLRSEFYHWQPIYYTPYLAAQYIVCRFPEEYGVLSKIFTELASRRPDFHPQSLLDFGSGVGTVPFAANGVFGKSLNEYVCVDSSADMIEMSKTIIDNDTKGEEPLLREVFHRQFLPGLRDRQYDIVTSAYSLLDLPNVRERLKTVRSLWQKTKRFLVLVELGSVAGYDLIMEARNHILQLDRAGKRSSRRVVDNLEQEEISQIYQNIPEPGEVFSPCPHKVVCPRQVKANSSVVCHFPISFRPLPFMSFRYASTMTSRYSYVVFEKSAAEGQYEEPSEQWPRLVESVRKRHHHAICRMCCSDGTLKELITTRDKHTGPLYNLSRQAKWGDRIPFVPEKRSPEEQKAYDESLVRSKQPSLTSERAGVNSLENLPEEDLDTTNHRGSQEEEDEDCLDEDDRTSKPSRDL